jgi:hypothetical protein
MQLFESDVWWCGVMTSGLLELRVRFVRGL